ncbi:MAG: hypothetical protein RLY86_608 [Pseudomonadota bacterium]|jgi:iron complex outermembrane receptor protein
MSSLKKRLSTLGIMAGVCVMLVPPVTARAQQPAPPAPPGDLEEIIVTGTRVANRSALDTAVPVDVVSADSLAKIGVSELNQALSVSLPSYNFPRPGLADGTDSVRPATLRGLAPDQTLVLVNSKRRHTAALVNVNGTIGRGSSAVDLNTIPNAILQSVEVLRDGASAQYGSDAIAGVLNLRLREADSGGNVTVSYGQRVTEVDVLVGNPEAGVPAAVRDLASRDERDGETTTVSAWKGLPLGDAGFITIAAEYKDQKRTERGGVDVRRQYPLVNGQPDPREATINRLNAWYGEPELEQGTVFANAGYDLKSGAKLYGWASFQERETISGGFYRISQDVRNIPQIYPDGFLPLINPTTTDFSVGGGITWEWAGWEMDASIVYGGNDMDFVIRNTLNASIGPTSPTVFDAGGYSNDQLVGNLSAVKPFEVGLASPLNVAIGVEARQEGYKINAGEPDSYRNGGFLLPTGLPRASGAQVFPGFRPANEVDVNREAVGAYVDMEANVTDQLLLSAAVRGEHYSDFGENLSAKLAGRFDFTDAFGIRGSVQNGFRAPSLQQQFFTATSTNFINGVPFDITTFPVNDPVAIALGAQPLDAEKSVNYAIGFVAQLGEISLTVDAYRIEIEDRIVLSENLTAANVRTFLTSRGFIGIGGGRFFLNGVDTTTEGIDIIANYKLDADAAGRFDITLGANFNETSVDRVPGPGPLASLSPPPVLFDRVNVLTFEEGNPKDKFTANLDWSLDRWGLTLRAIRYGKVLSPGTTAAADLTLDAATLVDLEGRVDLIEGMTLAIGADNVFDVYPTKNPPALNTTGNTPFSNYSPFGRSGRYIYARVSYDF